MTRRWLGVAVMVAACGDDGNAPADAPGPDAYECPSGTTATPANAYGFGSTINGALDEAVLCVHGRTDLPCRQSIGSFATVCAPNGVDFAVRASKFGWESTLNLFASGVPSVYTEQADNPAAKFSWELANGTYPSMTDANILVFLCDPTTCPDGGGDRSIFSGIEGAQIAIAPLRAPVYAGPNQLPDTALTMTSTSGMAWIPNVPVGTYDITITAPAGYTACQQWDRISGTGGGWASSVAGAHAQFPTIAATTTAILIRCTR